MGLDKYIKPITPGSRQYLSGRSGEMRDEPWVGEEWEEQGIFLVNKVTGERRLKRLADTAQYGLEENPDNYPDLGVFGKYVVDPDDYGGDPYFLENTTVAPRTPQLPPRLPGNLKPIEGGLPTEEIPYVPPPERRSIPGILKDAVVSASLGPIAQFGGLVGTKAEREYMRSATLNNAWGPFIGAAEEVGLIPQGTRAEVREGAARGLEKYLVEDPSGGLGRAAGLAVTDVATGLPSPSTLLGAGAGKLGVNIAQYGSGGAGLQRFMAMSLGAAENLAENVADTTDLEDKERLRAGLMGAGLGLVGGANDVSWRSHTGYGGSPLRIQRPTTAEPNPTLSPKLKSAEPLPLPFIDGDRAIVDDIWPAWSYVSRRHPVLASKIKRIRVVDSASMPNAQAAYAGVGDIWVRPGKVSVNSLMHELTHAAQDVRGSMPRFGQGDALTPAIRSTIAENEGTAFRQGESYRGKSGEDAKPLDFTTLSDDEMRRRAERLRDDLGNRREELTFKEYTRANYELEQLYLAWEQRYPDSVISRETGERHNIDYGPYLSPSSTANRVLETISSAWTSLRNKISPERLSEGLDEIEDGLATSGQPTSSVRDIRDYTPSEREILKRRERGMRNLPYTERPPEIPHTGPVGLQPDVASQRQYLGLDAAPEDANELMRVSLGLDENAPSSRPRTFEESFTVRDQPEIVRPVGWKAANDTPYNWTRPGHAYRGMTLAEYDATVGSGRGVVSRGDYSVPGEGTSFADHAADAESYVNFGRDDPRTTGRPTYMVEVTSGEDLIRDRDGYLKSKGEIPPDRITRVWKFTADQDGNLVANRADSSLVVGIGPGGRFSPSEAGFISLPPRTPAPDTPEGQAMRKYRGGQPNTPLSERLAVIPDMVRSFYTDMVNLDAPVERLGKREGASPTALRDVIHQVRRVRGAAGMAENMALSLNDANSLRSIWEGVDDVTYRDWADMATAERQLELRDRAAAGEDLDVDPQATLDAEAYMSNVAPGLVSSNPRLHDLVTRTRQWGESNILDPLVEAGVLIDDPDYRLQGRDPLPNSKQAILAKNQAYVPFFRVLREDLGPGAHGSGKWTSKQVKSISSGLSEQPGKAAKGWEKRHPGQTYPGNPAAITDPLEGLVRKAHDVRRFVESQKLRNMVADENLFPRDLFPEIHPVDTSPRIVANVDDEPVYRRQPIQKGDETFPVFINGEKQNWTAPRDLLNVLQQLGPYELQGVAKASVGVLRHFASMLRAGTTSTLEFALGRNPAFDQIDAMINSRAGYTPLDFFRGLWSVAKKDQWYDRYMRSGAAQSTMASLDRPEVVSRIADVRQKRGLRDSAIAAVRHYRDSVFPTSGKVLGMPLRQEGSRGFAPTQALLHPLQTTSQAFELPTRLGGYLAAENPTVVNKAIRWGENKLVPSRQRVGYGPLGPEIGLGEARENTLDFLRRGRIGAIWNSVEAFANAEVQGLDRITRALKSRPGPTVAKLMAIYTIPALTYWAAKRDDPEYAREPEWKKMMFYNIRLSTGSSILLPRGRGPGALLFSYLPEKIMDAMVADDPEAANEFIMQFVDNTPLHWGVDVRRGGEIKPSLDLIPTAVEPPAEIAMNYDTWRNAPVEPRGQERKLAPDRFTTTTSPTLRVLANKTGMSPLQLTHLFRGYLGGVGQYGLDVADKVVGSEFQDLPGDVTLPQSMDWINPDLPLARAYFSRRPIGFSSQPVQDAYMWLEKAEQAENSLKDAIDAGRVDRATEIKLKNPEYKYAGDLRKLSRSLSEIRKAQEYYRSLPAPDAATGPGTGGLGKYLGQNTRPTMTPEQIRAKLQELDLRATTIAEQFFKNFHVRP